MLFLREPYWIVFLCAFLGILFGRLKGRPGWGFLLGLFFGPPGLALVLLLPQARRPAASQSQGARWAFRAQATQGGAWRPTGEQTREEPRGSGPACPRCSKTVGRGDKACPHCGNVLVPIRYEVSGPGAG